MAIWYDIVPHESVVGLTCDDTYLYLMTTQRANGLPEHAERGHFVKWHPSRGVLDQLELDGYVPNWGVCAAAEGAYLVCGNMLYHYSSSRKALQPVAELPEAFRYLLRLNDGGLLVFGQHTAWTLDHAGHILTRCSALPGTVNGAAQASNGTVYVACGSHLYHLSL